MLSAKDKLAYKQGIYEIFETLATTVQYTQLNTSVERNIYGELTEETYSEPITLIAMVEAETKDSKNAEFKNEGAENELKVEIPLLELENHNINPYSLDDGYFIVDNYKYRVQAVKPKGPFAQMFSSYEFLCKGVDVL